MEIQVDVVKTPACDTKTFSISDRFNPRHPVRVRAAHVAKAAAKALPN
jgi:hypothetical protein